MNSMFRQSWRSIHWTDVAAATPSTPTFSTMTGAPGHVLAREAAQAAPLPRSATQWANDRSTAAKFAFRSTAQGRRLPDDFVIRMPVSRH